MTVAPPLSGALDIAIHLTSSLVGPVLLPLVVAAIALGSVMINAPIVFGRESVLHPLAFLA